MRHKRHAFSDIEEKIAQTEKRRKTDSSPFHVSVFIFKWIIAVNLALKIKFTNNFFLLDFLPHQVSRWVFLELSCE